MEPYLWNLGDPCARFPAAAPNHPEALWEELQAFQAVGEKHVKLLRPLSSIQGFTSRPLYFL